MNDNDLNRRNFISASATGAAVLLARPQAARAAAPSDRVRIGIIGAGNRGFNTLTKKLVGLRASGRNLDLVSPTPDHWHTKQIAYGGPV